MKMSAEDGNAGMAWLNRAGSEVSRHCAAAYVRVSTEHQQYSTRNQMEVIRSFARRRNWQVVREYSDEGKSGVKMRGRAALSQLIKDVVARNVNFNHILVYDVSRWGRFLDPDEAAHYEFLCRQAGVAVHYCAEPFENDGGLNSTVVKDFKRAMAAEYSRELSVKVFRGAARMIRMGYKQGGSAVFGLRRMLVDHNGLPKGVLTCGQRKSLQTDRVIYVPGPEAEIQVVCWIFEMFVNECQGATGIVRRLNERGLLPESGRPWGICRTRSLLENEKLIGNLVYARTASKLRSRLVPNPPAQWVRKEHAFAGIVPRELFFKAQEIIAASRAKFRFSDESMLEKMNAVLKEHGRLSTRLLLKIRKTPHPRTFRLRFGSLVAAYQQVGFTPRHDCRPLEITTRLFKISREVIAGIIGQIQRLGATATWNGSHHLLLINQELRVRVVFIRHNQTFHGTSRWILRQQRADAKPDLTVAARMDPDNEHILDYYLFPGMEPIPQTLQLSGSRGFLDAYRFSTLDFLVGMAARTRLSQTI
jgi:DNA invertase Pin-like site-specific DNA recombinase